MKQSKRAAEQGPSLPEFETGQDAADFVDTHSLAPYIDALEEVTDVVTVDLRRRRVRHDPAAPPAIRLPEKLHRELVRAAQQRGVAVDDLATALIAEGLSQAPA